MRIISNMCGIVALIALVSGALVSEAQGQNIRLVRLGDRVMPDGNRCYVEPETRLAVEVTVSRETIEPGPYARFAQRYFGVIAPLAAKSVCSVDAVSVIGYDTDMPIPDAGRPAAAIGLPEPPAGKPDAFPGSEYRVRIDRRSAMELNPEEAAAEAAQMIFNLRKRRVELIMGDVGENVYGEGMRAALDEMTRIENAYFALFFGERNVETVTERYVVTPRPDVKNYVICRFTESDGLVPASDLSGQPLVLELTPSGKASTLYPMTNLESAKGRKSLDPTAEYLISEPVTCRVSDGRKTFFEGVIPILQFGKKVSLPVESPLAQ